MSHGQGDASPDADDRLRLDALPRLDGVTPTQVASFIRSLGGRLVRLDARSDGLDLLVVYTFDVASRERSFEAAVRDGTVESIVPIFPEAASPEAELSKRLAIRFHTRPGS